MPAALSRAARMFLAGLLVVCHAASLVEGSLLGVGLMVFEVVLRLRDELCIFDGRQPIVALETKQTADAIGVMAVIDHWSFERNAAYAAGPVLRIEQCDEVRDLHAVPGFQPRARFSFRMRLTLCFFDSQAAGFTAGSISALVIVIPRKTSNEFSFSAGTTPLFHLGIFS